MRRTNLHSLTARAAMLTLAITSLAPIVLLAEDGQRCEAKLQTCVDEMIAHLEKRGWVGIELDTEHEGGILVTKVVPESPAEAAGLREGDVLTSMNGVAYNRDNYAELKTMYGEMVPGGEVTYAVQRRGEKLDVEVTLGKIPEAVIAKWVGYHVMHAHGDEESADGGDG